MILFLNIIASIILLLGIINLNIEYKNIKYMPKFEYYYFIFLCIGFICGVLNIMYYVFL